MTPAYRTSTCVQDSPGERKGYQYARPGHPTRTALEGNPAALESGAEGGGLFQRGGGRWMR